MASNARGHVSGAGIRDVFRSYILKKSLLYVVYGDRLNCFYMVLMVLTNYTWR